MWILQTIVYWFHEINKLTHISDTLGDITVTYEFKASSSAMSLQGSGFEAKPIQAFYIVPPTDHAASYNTTHIAKSCWQTTMTSSSYEKGQLSKAISYGNINQVM